jgi:small subunit ribosomal protein S4
MEKPSCKICRRLGVKLFLKGEKCLSPKCPMLKRPYPPGQRGKRRPSLPSEYNFLLKEKQKLKKWYNLDENQLKRYIKEVFKKKREDMPELLIQKLEKRLDNTVFRLGFAVSRKQARQLVSHGFFLVNGRSVNFPAFEVKEGDLISFKPTRQKKEIFSKIKTMVKKQKTPSWLQLDPEKLEGKVIGKPNLAEAAPPADIASVFEFYSK